MRIDRAKSRIHVVTVEFHNMAIKDLQDSLRLVLDAGIIASGTAEEVVRKRVKEVVGKAHARKICQLPNGWWSTHIYVNGERRTITRHSERELLCALYDHYTGAEEDPEAARYTLNDIFKNWSQGTFRSVSGSTARRNSDLYRKFICNSKIADIPVPLITTREVLRWIDDILGSPEKPNMTRKMFNGPFGVLSSMLRYYAMTYPNAGFRGAAATIGDIRIGRTRFVRATKKTSTAAIFTASEIKAIVAASMELASEKHDPLYLAIPIALYSGTRPEEAMALCYDDYSNGVLHIHQRLAAIDVPNPNNACGFSRKWTVIDAIKQNGQDRFIDVADIVSDYMNLVQAMTSDNSTLLFNVGPLKPYEVRMKNVCDRLGIAYKPPAALRKTVCKLFLRRL